MLAAIVSLACVVAVKLTPIDEPLVVLVVPILISAYVGGLRTGLISTIVMAIAGAVLVESSRDIAELLALLAAGSVASVLGEMNKASLARALASEHMYSTSFHASPVPLVLTDLTTGRHVDANEAYCALVGRTRAELAGSAASERSPPGDARGVPVQIRHTNGAVHDALLSSVMVSLDGRAHELTTIIDVSARKRAESEARESALRSAELEAELQQTQKMESLGRLAGGVAHDFNNVLAVIAMNASLLRESVPDEGEPAELVGEITHAVGRATGLTRQLLAFSRKQTAEPTVLDVNEVIGETRKMLRRMIGEDIELGMSLEPELAHVKMDAGLLVQVLMNLAVNARDAMPNGGQLTLTTRNAPSGDAVTLAVTDTGCGMTEEVRKRAFEPFFTTKAVGRGTGMGLSVVLGVVQQAGGRIEIETQPGAGTTFLISLPTTTSALAAHAEFSEAMPRGAEHVLVVDDDPFVRAATARALRGAGYQTLEASDGEGALAVLAQRPVDLLLTDVVMPGMNGSELARAARSSRPALKILFTSGYTDDEVLARGVLRGEVQLLEKPFRRDKLATKVRSVLDEAA